MLLLLVRVISSIVLKILEEKTVWLRYEEHELVEHLSNNVLPVFLVSLFFKFLLLRIWYATTYQSLVLALLSMQGVIRLHCRDIGNVGVGLPCCLALAWNESSWYCG